MDTKPDYADDKSPYALYCKAYGNPPIIDRHTLPTLGVPSTGQVLINVHCAAFNFTDHLLVQGRYQDKPQLPFIPGLDAGGIVHSVGPDVTDFRPGDKVVSSGVVGAWATQLLAPADRLVAVPEQVSLADAVASINSHLTAYHGLLDRAQLQAGERVLVLAANGAVGKAAVQIARYHHADVFTVERAKNNHFQLTHLESGTGHCVAPDALKEGLREILGKRGADIVVDPVGDHFSEAAVRNLAWRGRLLVIGFAAGDIPKIPTNLLLLKGATLLGVYCGGLLQREHHTFTRQLAEMFQLMQIGALSPLPHETLSAKHCDDIFSQFSSAPRGSKIMLGFAA